MYTLYTQNLWKGISMICLTIFLCNRVEAQDTIRTSKVFETDASDMLKLMNQKNQEEELVSVTGYKETLF